VASQPAPPPAAAPTAAETAAARNAAADTRASAVAEPARERDSAPFAAAPGGAAAFTAWPSFAEPEGRLRWRIVGGRRIESSSDGGASWNRTFDESGVRLFAGSAPSMSATWVCGAKGVVLRRVYPGGWTRVAVPSSEDLVSVSATSEASARVTTRSGQVFETSDGGATWTAR
jgi:photosystem II stability/assembly factor-like uncharacterized protein